MIMKLISKNKLKEINKLRLVKERNKQKLFLVFDENSIKKAQQLNLLVDAYKTLDGVIGVVKFLPIIKLGNHIIYLDEITDPSNLGKIILLMVNEGFNDLILSPKCVSLYNEKCLDIVKENIFNINVTYGDINTLRMLKENYQIIATGLQSACYLDEVKLNNRYVLIFGNEAHGVNKDILKLANQIIKIPINNIDSLNVSVAAAIILHNLK